jgi:cation transport protein ChaC
MTFGPVLPDPFWVFAYGSLMWRPDFPFVERREARLWGYHRSLCILSTHYRGTPERPGLVLGLDRGGSCRGRAFRVPADSVAEAHQRLIDREMISGVYRPCVLPAMLDGVGRVAVWAFVAERANPQYSPPAGAGHAAALIRQGWGVAGSSRDYLADTVTQLDALGVRDGALHRLLALVDSPAPIVPP